MTVAIIPPWVTVAYILDEGGCYDGRRPRERDRAALVRTQGPISIQHLDNEGFTVDAWRGASPHLARLILEEHGFTFEPRRCQWYRGVTS